jgi:hypothetical protein
MASNTPPSENTTIKQQANNNAKQFGPVGGNLTFNEYHAHPKDSPSKKGNNKSIPDYLWYLPDRGKQKDKLCKAIQEHEKNAKHRPLLCLIYGKMQEEHYSFKDCFVEKEIDKLYQNDKNDVTQTRIITFPKDIEGFHKTILGKLREDFFEDLFIDADLDDLKIAIAKRLFEETRPIILCIDIFIESYQDRNDLIKQGIFDNN